MTKKKLSDEEIYDLSTTEEQTAVDYYRWAQQQYGLDVGDMMMVSQAMEVIIKRNKRLGLI